MHTLGNLLRRAAPAALIAAAVSVTPAVAAQDSDAVTVFVARMIVTMDPGWPVATAGSGPRWCT